MSPHALSNGTDNYRYDTDASCQPASPSGSDDIPSLVGAPKRMNFERFDDEEVHDLICVGFGPASLAIAVALHDALETNASTLSSRAPKVRFLERQDRFAWHAGMLLPGAKMQISFVKDLATLRNPCSHFTFLNYLHEKGRLVSFANLGTFLPQRIEYEDYMRWCADHFDDLVDYSQDVQGVEVASRHPKSGVVETFQVNARNHRTGHVSKLRARHVVIAAGGKPSIPKCLSAPHPRIIHSSQYATRIGDIFPPGSRPKKVAVIGGGQSAAEIFHNIPSRFPGTQAVLLIRGASLRPSDDSPFVNEVFNPERVDDTFSQHPDLRADAIALDRATNYGVVRLELLEEIYSQMYSYRIRHASEDDWPHQILPYRNVTGISSSDVSGSEQFPIQLHIQNSSSAHFKHQQPDTETLPVDLVVVASGYRRDAHEDMLASLRSMMPDSEGDVASRKWTVRRDYGVVFRNGAVSSDAGVWLQGCNESTHGLADSLLSILAVRGGELVESIFGRAQRVDGRV